MKASEAAEFIGCSVSHVRYLIRSKVLKAKRVWIDNDRNGKKMFMYEVDRKSAVRVRDDPGARPTRGRPKA